MMRQFTAGTDLVRPGVTRFATSFLSLHSLNELKDKLRTMFVSNKWKGSKWSKEAKGKKPLVKVLRLVHSERKPVMGHIFKAMEWDLQLERLLHLARYFLNPAYFYSDPEIERKYYIMIAFNKCNGRLHPDVDVQDKVSAELDFYCYSMGTLGSDIAVRQMTKIYPSSWWANHGQSAPNLQKMAQLVLNLTCTTSGCECNFSTFKMRFQIEDPIIVEDLDQTSEWLVEPDAKDEHVFEGESLTWTQVQEEAGLALSPVRATKSQTQRGRKWPKNRDRGRGKRRLRRGGGRSWRKRRM
ncbi:hypothetical protein AMTRI_Chr03g52000 [Amborella trichopoda]